VGILENIDDRHKLLDLFEDLKLSFKENLIQPVIPFRVLGEIDRFNAELTRYLEYNFPIYPPIDIDNDSFYLNVKMVNRSLPKKHRFFHASEITDIVVLTIAKQIHDAMSSFKSGRYKRKMPRSPGGKALENSDGKRISDNFLEFENRLDVDLFEMRDEIKENAIQIWIVSNDEGIQKASVYFLGNAIKVMEPFSFLTYIFGVSDSKDLRDKVESLSKRVFSYFTRYRVYEGRKPVSQLDNFFSEMLNSIRMARADIAPFFSGEIIQSFEAFMIQGKELKSTLSIYQETLSVLKDILNLDDVTLISKLEYQLNELTFTLFNLISKLYEPADYIRFYNYMSLYLIRIYLIAFKQGFLMHEFGVASRYIQSAKLICRSMLIQENLKRIHISILLVETLFLMIVGDDRSNEIAGQIIEHLRSLWIKSALPAFVPAEQLYLILIINHFQKGQELKVTRSTDFFCTITGEGLSVSSAFFNSFFGAIEDFCDELASFGNLDLALSIYVGLYKLLMPRSEEFERMEGKIYLTCLILNKPIPKNIAKNFKDFKEETALPLVEAMSYPELTDIENVDDAFKRRIKILQYIKKTRQHYIFKVWVYPLKSRFVLKVPVNLLDKNPYALKEVKVLSGKIKVHAKKQENTRGIIEISKNSYVMVSYYREKFFTLNLI
ncbi:MAG: hypothetical protein ACTSRA_17175, partial [Promethearchaeota archaeon]